MTSRLRPACRAIALLASAALASAAAAATFTVTNTADSGAGSLRQAVLDANGNPGSDLIAFAIPGSGVQTILLSTPLEVTDVLNVDGYSQPGSSVNTDPAASNAVILIDLQGTGDSGFIVTGGPLDLRGVAMHGFLVAVDLGGNGGSFVGGCFIGLTPAGDTAPGNSVGIWSHGAFADGIGDGTGGSRNVISGHLNGIVVENAAGRTAILGNLIGTNAAGTAALMNENGILSLVAVRVGEPAHGNVISGNLFEGVRITGGGASNVVDNLVGLDAAGLAPLGNGRVGVYVDADSPTITGNHVSANGSHGIDLVSSIHSRVSDNFIGLNQLGAGEFGNGGAGIHLLTGSDAILGDNNQIANNAAGIWWESPAFNANFTIGVNSIYRNEGLGIVTGGAPPAIHPDAVPVITSVVPGATTTTIQGYWDFGTAGTFQGGSVNFYTSPACSKKRPWHFDEGKTYIGSVGVGGGGHMTFSYAAPVVVTDEVVTAFATYVICAPMCFVPQGEGGFATFKGTTPFSQRLPYAIDPASGSPAGGDPLVIAGTNFQAGAAVTVGGAPGGSVNIAGPNEVDLTAPALPAGAAYDVSVVNTDGSGGTIPLAWLADFLDVPPSHFFHDFVRKLVTNGVASGVGGGNFGLAASTLRQQMAVFLLKAKHGFCYTPPPCAGVFADVPCPSPFADWIEQLAAEGITGGCGGGNFCPTDAVRRDQMAVFLLKAEHGSSYVPPECGSTFADVPCPSPFADWIEHLAFEGITGGCGGGNYCPSAPNTRGQMAVFLTKTFDLQ